MKVVLERIRKENIYIYLGGKATFKITDHTHTHTQAEREREREREQGNVRKPACTKTILKVWFSFRGGIVGDFNFSFYNNH